MRAREVRFNRFLGNAKVTTTRIIESWSDGTGMAAEGRRNAGDPGYPLRSILPPRHKTGVAWARSVMATPARVLLHPMLAADAESGCCLGLLHGEIWTRQGRRTVSHDNRDLKDKDRNAGSRPLCTA